MGGKQSEAETGAERRAGQLNELSVVASAAKSASGEVRPGPKRLLAVAMQKVVRPGERLVAKLDPCGAEDGGEEEEAVSGAVLPALSLLPVAVVRARPGHRGFRPQAISEPRLTNPSEGWRWPR